MPMPDNSALSRVVCTFLELGSCSSQLALRVQMNELRVSQCWCSMHTCILKILKILCLTWCVCAHCHACKESANQVRWLVQACCNSPCACSRTALRGLRLCNLESLCNSSTRVVPSLRDASSQQQVAGMQLCSSDIKLNFLLIANMQKHDPARDTDLHFAASPFERPSMY